MEKRSLLTLKRSLLKSFIPVFLLFVSIQSLNAQRIVGYYPSYRGSTYINTVQWNCITDIFYAFATVDNAGNVSIQDPTTFALVKAKCKPLDPNGPVLWLSVGGAGQSGSFATVAGSGTATTNMVNQLVTLCNNHNLEGIDIDWEFPATWETGLHESLMGAINTGIGTRKLCMAVGGEYTGSIKHTDYCTSTAMTYCDYINVMTYDFPATYNADHSTLNNSQLSVQAWNTKGGGNIMHKLLIGIPFYGRPNPRTSVDYRFNQLTPTEQTTALSSGQAAGYYWNTTATIQGKVDWIMGQGGNGVLIWDLGQDVTGTNSLQTIICNRMATACPAPTPALGADVGICGTGSVTIGDATINTTNRTFSWLKNGAAYTGNTRTISVSTPGTYRLTVTQGTCSRYDEIVVVQTNTVTATGGSTSCGTGTVTLNATGPGGTYEWYDALTNGNKVGTGATFTTPPISTTTNYYVQQSTGSTTSYTGQGAINVGTAANEFGSDANPGTKPVFFQKFTASQSLTIQSVTVYTNGTSKTGAKVIAYNSVTGAEAFSSAPFNLTGAYGVPQVCNINLALPAGTYFIGIYVPNSSTGNACLWRENTPQSNYTVSGICTLEGRCYAYDPLGTQNPAWNWYGNLFNWVIVTGATNPCARTTVTATVTGTISAPGTITGNSAVCTGSTVQNYSIAPVSGATSYTWTYTGTGATVSGTTTSATITFAAGASNGNVSVTATGSCGTSTASIKPITVSSTPAVPGTITGSTTACAGAKTYTITAVPNATSYTWSYTGTGGTPSGTTTTGTITYAAGAGAGNVTVTANNTCGSSAAKTLAVAAGVAVPATPGTITGPTTACAGAKTYTISAVTNATSYTWSYTGTGGTPSGTTTTGTITYAAGAGAGNVTVVANGTCGSSAAKTLAVAAGVAVPATPGTITGITTACPGVQTYTISAVTNANSYTWSYTGTGGTASGTTTTGTITYAAGATAGNVSVVANGTCGNSAAKTLAVAAGAAPATPGNITGPTTACAGAQTYSIVAVSGATSYTWAYTGTGATVSGTTTSATITFAAGASAGNVTVTANNSCGSSAAKTLAVAAGVAVPATPGNISGSTAVTQGSTGNAYSIAAVSGATSYTWSYTGTGQTITNGSTTNASYAFSGTATSGNITVTATNACGTSAPKTLPVTVSPATAISLSSTDKIEAYVQPNPFDNEGQLVITVPKNMIITAILYDVIGNEKAVILKNQSINPGEHTYAIPDNLSPGMYLLRVEGDKQVQTIRIIKTK